MSLFGLRLDFEEAFRHLKMERAQIGVNPTD